MHKCTVQQITCPTWRLCLVGSISRISAEFRRTFRFLLEGVSQSRLLSDLGPYRSSGCINTTKQHEISRRIQWGQSRGLKPRLPGTKIELFNWQLNYPGGSSQKTFIKKLYAFICVRGCLGQQYIGWRTRCFGDLCVKRHGIIAEPEIVYWSAEENVSAEAANNECYVLCASDGIWEFMDTETVPTLNLHLLSLWAGCLGCIRVGPCL